MPALEKEVALFPESLLQDPVAAVAAQQTSERALEDGQGARWWVAHTRPRQEKALARALLAAEVPFYLPLVAKDSLVRGKLQTAHVPVFASYVFLHTFEEERLGALKTGRVVRLLPVLDGDGLRRDLQGIQRLIELDAPLTVERRIQPGTWVRVRRGPMEGLEGIVEGRKGRTRLIVLVRMLQQGVSLEIEDSLLEPL
jgi:transcriptional antiterminator RfaH